jgi:hypothetical protein
LALFKSSDDQSSGLEASATDTPLIRGTIDFTNGLAKSNDD